MAIVHILLLDLNWHSMNEISIRRSKIAKELSKQQKEKYFQ